jgi:hypothetical protein
LFRAGERGVLRRKKAVKTAIFYSDISDRSWDAQTRYF